MSPRFKVRLSHEMLDFARDVVRLQAVDESGRWLMDDGSWRVLDDALRLPGEAGIVIPVEMVEPLAVAIATYQGHVGHADTEARVLREWLSVEQARVDAVLDAK